MTTKEIRAYAQLPVKFLKETKFNKVGEVANLREDVAVKLIEAGVAEKYVVAPQAKKVEDKADKK